MRKGMHLKSTRFCFQLFVSDCLFQSETNCLETDLTLASGPRSCRCLHQGVSGTVCLRRPNIMSMGKFPGPSSPGVNDEDWIPRSRRGNALRGVVIRIPVVLYSLDVPISALLPKSAPHEVADRATCSLSVPAEHGCGADRRVTLC